MELKLIELLMTEPLVFIGMAVLVWLLTYLVKIPIKKITAAAKDDKKRKLYNKWILLIPFILALTVYYVYYGLTFKIWVKVDYELILSSAFSIAVLAITIYNVFEGLRGKKTEYETTIDGQALYNLLLIYTKDKNKVKLLLEQCKENYSNASFEISDTVKGWLPGYVDDDVVNTIVKSIKLYLDKYNKISIKSEEVVVEKLIDGINDKLEEQFK